jgi:hypothetical protein
VINLNGHDSFALNPAKRSAIPESSLSSVLDPILRTTVWIPAFAGMTYDEQDLHFPALIRPRRFSDSLSIANRK